MILPFRPLTIALMVALLAATGPAQASVRPAADHRFGRTPVLTPLPLDGRTARWMPMDGAAAVPLHPAAEDAEATAAEANADALAPLLAFSGLGALLVLFVTLLVMGYTPRRDRAA